MPGLSIARIYGVSILLPDPGRVEGLFAARLAEAAGVPVFRPLSLGDLIPQALRSLRGKCRPDSAYPRTGALAAWLRFCVGRPVVKVTCPELFLDMVATAHGRGQDILFITGNRGDFQEFRRQVSRMYPGMRLNSHLEAAIANERTEDTLAFMAKMRPWAVYLGPDVLLREELSLRIIGAVESVKAVVLGGDDFILYTRPAVGGEGVGGKVASALESFRRRPLGGWRLFTAGILLLDGIRVKLFGHYKLEVP